MKHVLQHACGTSLVPLEAGGGPDSDTCPLQLLQELIATTMNNDETAHSFGAHNVLQDSEPNCWKLMIPISPQRSRI